jgi:cytochrome P450
MTQRQQSLRYDPFRLPEFAVSLTIPPLQYCLMELINHPDVMDRIRAEHDDVLDKDLDETIDMLGNQPQKMNALPLTNAVIKEVLRLYAPGSTVRVAADE